jgi:hypothetical protein
MTPSQLDKSESGVDLLVGNPLATAPRHLLIHSAFIFAVAILLRLATGALFLHGFHGTIDGPGFAESTEAVGIAQSLASGNGFSRPWPGAGPTAWLTPIMPAILAADMLIFGLHTRATLIAFVMFNEVCSALTILPVFFAARRIAGGQTSGDPGADRIAALAAWLFVLDPLAASTACKNIWYTTLSGLLGALLLWATLAVRDSKKPMAWIGYGLLWGAELMTHPSFLVLMPVALLWLVWPRRGPKQLTLPAFACLVAVLCCVPWTVRNFVVFHHVVPLRSDFGFELWRFNHDGPSWLYPHHDPAERAAFASLGEYAYVHEKQREALAWIGAHPDAFMRGTARRVMQFWFGIAHPMRELVHGKAWFFKAKFLYISALLVMVLGGLISLRRHRCEYLWLLGAFPAIFPLVYYIAVARDFHRVPIDPVLAIIAAFAMSAWLPAEPREERQISAATSTIGRESV